jgi:uncharacterized protein
MAHSDSPSLEFALKALDSFLLSDRAPENCMGLSNLDGFLTGIVVGPEMILPSEWLPIIWGGDEPEFADIGEAQSILGTIMARYDQIVMNLDAGLDASDLLFSNGPEDEVIVTDWAAGFVDAVRLRQKAWTRLIRHRVSRAVIMPVILLGADDDDHPPLGAHPLPADELERLLVVGAKIIPLCVVGIDVFWRARRSKWKPKMTRNRRRPDAHRRRDDAHCRTQHPSRWRRTRRGSAAAS